MHSDNAISSWISQVREQSHLKVSRIAVNKSAQWFFSADGFLRHRSARFFQVAGVRWQGNDGVKACQPLFVQQEVGTLGFILNDFQLLVQAKVEPGNVGSAQLAPTVQATASNLEQMHGGSSPLFSELFTSPSENLLHDSLQSEQGSRFFGKLNRNLLLRTDVTGPVPNSYRWLPLDAVLELASSDFLINTDARSVLVCSPWEHLVKRRPFTRFGDSFSRELADSFSATGFYQSLSDVRTSLRSLRAHAGHPELVGLKRIEGWELHDDGIRPLAGTPFQILQIDVSVAGREVTTWDQPIISSAGEGYVELVCGRINGILCFLFVAQVEAGLRNMAELGPSLVVEPGETLPEYSYFSRPDAVVVAECQQSDEGGRFYHDTSLYRLIDAGGIFDPPEHGCWLTLAQMRILLGEGGWITNEARSAISLLLPLL